MRHNINWQLQEAATNFLSSREASGRPMTGSQVEQANKILNDLLSLAMQRQIG